MVRNFRVNFKKGLSHRFKYPNGKKTLIILIYDDGDGWNVTETRKKWLSVRLAAWGFTTEDISAGSPDIYLFSINRFGGFTPVLRSSDEMPREIIKLNNPRTPRNLRVYRKLDSWIAKEDPLPGRKHPRGD